MRSAYLIVTLASLANAAAAQGSSDNEWPLRELRFQLGFLRLYDGDATVGTVTTQIPSIAFGYGLPFASRSTVLEASAAHVGQDNDPYNRAPAFTVYAASVRQSLLPKSAPLEPFLSLGMGQMRIDVDEVVCEPPLCFREGGPNFVDGRFTTLVASAGLIVAVTKWGALRADLRWLRPINPGPNARDSGGTRFEPAVGILLRW